MEAGFERNWTANVVIASDHAGLRKYFDGLQAEMYRVLARVDDPRALRIPRAFGMREPRLVDRF